MSDLNLSLIIRAVDQASKPLRRVGKALTEVSRRTRLARLTASLSKVKEKLRDVAVLAGKAGKKLREIGGTAFARITSPIALLGGFALNAFGKMEQLRVAFESMLGSADAARSMVKKLANFAASTPFQLEGIGAAAKQLLSFGVTEGDVIGRLKMLGDIAAGANVPLRDMAAIFGKAKAKGKAMTEELLQLSDRGVPIIAVLAKQLKKPKEAIFDLASKGKISFEILSKAMASMTRPGGIFFDQMKKQSETLFGLLSTLKDNVFLALVPVGDIMVRTFSLKKGMTDLTNWLQTAIADFKEFAKANPELTKVIFILGAIAAAAGPVLIVLGVMSSGFGVLASGAVVLMGGLSFVVTGITAIGGAMGSFIVALRAGYSVMAAFNLVLAANPIGVVIIAVAALAAAAYLIWKNWDWVAAKLAAVWDGMKKAAQYVKVMFLSLASVVGNAMAGMVDMLPKFIQSKFNLSGIGKAAKDMNRLRDQAGLDLKMMGQTASPGNRRSSLSDVHPGIGKNSRSQVDVSLKIDAEGRPRVTAMKTSDRHVNIDVDAGMAMAGSS